ILPMGDNLEYRYSYPQPYHGCLWLENKGGWDFVPHRIAEFGGAYAAATGDLDGDGDRDVVLVSMVSDWQKPENASIVWLENDGRQNFTLRRIDNQPTHLITVACGDLNRDGRDDVVAGVLKVMLEREDRDGRIISWISERKQRP
ncbi:MAG: VCBS repeat-containing protein, partial [Planctomycetes bacterium]|nr:VCBS repeat-containing protein [Planctomycetota bacterium]